MKRCLVTGGAGFIGSHLADRLIALGHQVTVIDNESTGFRHNVNPRARYIRGDVTSLGDLEKAFAPGLDVVFHIAGQASTIKSFHDPQADLNTNVVGTINVLKKCVEHRVPRMLYASSMPAYGHPPNLPVVETELCKPISYYGVTKYAAERYVLATAERNDLDFPFVATCFRMFNVYGPRQSLSNPYKGVVAIFISNLLNGQPITIFGDGEQSRDFVHIGDVVDAWVAAVDNEAARNQVFNLGTGRRHSVNQLVDVVLAAFGKSRSTYSVVYEALRPGDQRHMEADVSKAASLLRWRPRINFEQGMTETIAWARSVHKQQP